MAVNRSSVRGKVRAATNRVFGALHRSIYRLTGGKVMGRMAGAPVLLLTVTGRRSGRRRTVPLIYWSRGDDYVVSASAAGAWLPMWYRNLQANREAVVEVGRDRFTTEAHLADEAESRDLWAVTESLNTRFAAYRESLPHEIPMVVLSRPG